MKNENGNNQTKNLLPEQINFLKLKLIIYNKEKTLISKSELINLYKILDSIESKTSLLDKELNYQISMLSSGTHKSTKAEKFHTAFVFILKSVF